MPADIVSDELWDEFHRVVNMTSRELDEWLRVESAAEVTEEVPDHAGTSLGRRVLGVLTKRRTDLNQDDVAAMESGATISSRSPGTTTGAGA